MTLNDLEPPIEGFLANFSLFWAAAHTLVNCNEMVGDRPRHPAYKISSIKQILVV